eukprot:767096-Hanusia_phi.AAC.2
MQQENAPAGGMHLEMRVNLQPRGAAECKDRRTEGARAGSSEGQGWTTGGGGGAKRIYLVQILDGRAGETPTSLLLLLIAFLLLVPDSALLPVAPVPSPTDDVEGDDLQDRGICFQLDRLQQVALPASMAQGGGTGSHASSLPPPPLQHDASDRSTR